MDFLSNKNYTLGKSLRTTALKHQMGPNSGFFWLHNPLPLLECGKPQGPRGAKSLPNGGMRTNIRQSQVSKKYRVRQENFHTFISMDSNKSVKIFLPHPVVV